MNDGVMCDRNWSEGTIGCQTQAVVPHFGRAEAPAVLGFDANIISLCAESVNCSHRSGPIGPPACIRGGFNILALFSRSPAYNMCRNLEWVICALRGRLRSQPRGTIIFDPSPGSMRMGVLRKDAASNLYSMKSVYFLETCIISTLCRNRAELFRTPARAPFHCDYDENLLGPLVMSLLREPTTAGP